MTKIHCIHVRTCQEYKKKALFRLCQTDISTLFRFGSLNNRNLLSPTYGRQKSEIQGLTKLVFPEISFFSVEMSYLLPGSAGGPHF